MKAIFRTLFTTLSLFVCVCVSAQQKENDVFVPISKYISQGNVDALSAWFDDNLEISVISKSTEASKAQARQILKTFFESHTPRTFIITHQAGKGNMKYALAELNAGGERFQVMIFVSCVKGSYRIQQLKIDRI